MNAPRVSFRPTLAIFRQAAALAGPHNSTVATIEFNTSTLSEAKNVMESDNHLPLQWSKSSIRALTRADILVADGFALPEVAVVIEIFHKANALIATLPDRHPLYEVALLSASGGRIVSSSSVVVWTQRFDCHRGKDDKRLLFIAGGVGVRDASKDERMIDWLCRQYSSSEMVQPIAEGRCLLDAAALSSKCLSDSNGDGSLHEIYGSLTPTSGAGLVALRIVEQDLGASTVKLISDSLSTHQAPSFSELFETSVDRPPSDNIKVAVRWMNANLTCPISIDAVAEAAAMSERNFLRRFKKEIGMTPSDYLLHARLSLCCRMLGESRLPVDKIARHCGFSDGGPLSKLFRKYLSTTPTAYRDARKAVPLRVSSS